MKINNEILLIFLAITFSCNIVYGQHPSIYLKDIYDLEWCQNMNIKSIKSMGDNYTLKNGIMIGEQAKNINAEKGGEVIKYTYGNGTINVTTYLTSDFKRIREMKLGPQMMFFYYNGDELLSYKVAIHSESRFGSMVEEMVRESDGKLISKEIYDYDQSVTKYKHNLEQLQKIDRKFRERWDYKYDEAGKVEEITVNKYISESGNIESKYILKLKYENDLPISMEVGELEDGEVVYKKKREFKYSF